MYWFGIDLESTGLDTSSCRIIEIGAVVWDVFAKAPIEIYSGFLKDESYPPLSKEIINITGITQDQLDEWGQPPDEVISKVLKVGSRCDYYVAHNGTNFDRPLLKEECARNAVWFEDSIPWIDSSVDVPYTTSTRKLTHLAAEHGFANPFQHRAAFDVLTMFKILSQYDSEDIMRLAKSPSLNIRAQVTYNDRDLAKARGYRWQGDKKWWVKTIKECQLKEEINNSAFEVQMLEG